MCVAGNLLSCICFIKSWLDKALQPLKASILVAHIEARIAHKLTHSRLFIDASFRPNVYTQFVHDTQFVIQFVSSNKNKQKELRNLPPVLHQKSCFQKNKTTQSCGFSRVHTTIEFINIWAPFTASLWVFQRENLLCLSEGHVFSIQPFSAPVFNSKSLESTRQRHKCFVQQRTASMTLFPKTHTCSYMHVTLVWT